MSEISFAQIARPGDLTEIGKGGEGRVYTVKSIPGMVYKEFIDFPGHTPNRSALEELMVLLQQMTPDERTWLSDRTTWPQTLVVEGNKMKGFLMPLIGQQYFKKYGIRANPKNVACEWNYMSMRSKFESNKNIYSEVPRVTPLGALLLWWTSVKRWQSCTSTRLSSEISPEETCCGRMFPLSA